MTRATTPRADGGPRLTALDRGCLDRCYRHLERRRTFRPAVEILLGVFAGDRLNFDHEQLLAARGADGRFHLRCDGQVKAKRRYESGTPVR